MCGVEFLDYLPIAIFIRTQKNTSAIMVKSSISCLLFISLLLSKSFFAASVQQNGSDRFIAKKFLTINQRKMAYVEVGNGDPIVFLHGNPTSSYLWRNIMPQLEGLGRLIAPDLIGMGDSDKLDPRRPDRYTFIDHTNYLYPLLERLGVSENVTLVIHDWGSALGFLWAYYQRYNPRAVKAIVFMESLVAPFPSFEELPPGGAETFNPIRGPAGEQLILQENFFIEQSLFFGLNLTENDKAEYRRPFLKPGEDRRPMLTWARQFPVAGEPKDVVNLISTYSKWLENSTVRKLFIDVEPGALSPFARNVVRNWSNLSSVTIPGLHFVQENSPDEVAKAIRDWL